MDVMNIVYAVVVLGVLGAAVGGAAGGAHDHGHMEAAVGHVAHLGGLVDQLVHHAEEEIAVLQIAHGAHAAHALAHADAGDENFRDGGVEHPVRAEFLGQAPGDGERAAEAAV